MFMVSIAVAEPALPTGLGTPAPASEPSLPMGLRSTSESSEPALPMGLSSEIKSSGPSLPAGLGKPSEAAEPALPSGLGSPELKSAPPHVLTLGRFAEDLHGFAEVRGGIRLQSDPYERNETIGETRLQLRYDHAFDTAVFTWVSDFLYDPVLDDHSVDLEDGKGWFDLRQANLLFRPAAFMDVKVGRQVNTWGTGDLLFINDLFPKDWNSFFIGRDDEYLKAPSDSLKTSFFSDLVNLDLIYSPRFDSDRSIDAERLSYWNPALGRRSGRDVSIDNDKPDGAFSDDEWAGRLYRNIGVYEVAAYGYDGFWKSPAGSDPETGKAIFPRLQVIGTSARGPLGKGILSLETGWFRSADDRDGNDPYIRNSEVRYLVGYEQEVLQNFIVGFQYYIENMLDYDEYKATLPDGMSKTEEFRQVVTLRLTKLMMSQNLRLGLFVFYSPSDDDAYLRPNVNYKLNDHWIIECGGNIFIGKKDTSFFGQFENNNNIYASVRYGF